MSTTPTPGEPAADRSGGTADPTGRASGAALRDPAAHRRTEAATHQGPGYVGASEHGPTGDHQPTPGATGVIRVRKPGRHRRRGDRVVRGLTAAGALLLLVACGFGARAAAQDGGGDPPPAGAEPTAAAPSQPVATKNPKADGSWGPVSGQSPVAATTERAAAGLAPTGVRIPAIGVNASSLVPLKIIPTTGELEAPAQFSQTGWYAAGPVPGEPGPAVIAAHVDSRAGPAVFFRLKELEAGDKVYVPRTDGSTATFTVTDVERYPKNAFPTQRVHGPTPDRALRLITCGGSFDYAKRSYRDNIVVYAVRV